MRPSIVAMLGSIMPAPLEMPVTVMVAPVDDYLARHRLGHRVRGHDRFGRGGQLSAEGAAPVERISRPARLRRGSLRGQLGLRGPKRSMTTDTVPRRCLAR